MLLQLGGFPNVKTMNAESSGPKPHLTGTCTFFLPPSQKRVFIFYFFNPNVKKQIQLPIQFYEAPRNRIHFLGPSC